jgi:hypothetical protein
VSSSPARRPRLPDMCCASPSIHRDQPQSEELTIAASGMPLGRRPS